MFSGLYSITNDIGVMPEYMIHYVFHKVSNVLALNPKESRRKYFIDLAFLIRLDVIKSFLSYICILYIKNRGNILNKINKNNLSDEYFPSD